MATDPTRITIAQMARVYLAPVGSIAPADESASLDAAWREVGLFTPDSVRFTDDPSFEAVTSHQSAFPTRRFQTASAGSFEVDLQEFSGKNLLSVFGGGTLSQVSSGHYKFVPPVIGGRSSAACLLDITDGARKFRLVIPQADCTEQVQFDMRRTNETTLPLRLAILGSDAVDPYYWLSNAADWNPAGS